MVLFDSWPWVLIWTPLSFHQTSDQTPTFGLQPILTLFYYFGYSTSCILLSPNPNPVLILCSQFCNTLPCLLPSHFHCPQLLAMQFCLVYKPLVHVCIQHLNYQLVYPSTWYFVLHVQLLHPMPAPKHGASSFITTLCFSVKANLGPNPEVQSFGPTWNTGQSYQVGAAHKLKPKSEPHWTLRAPANKLVGYGRMKLVKMPENCFWNTFHSWDLDDQWEFNWHTVPSY